jgi:2-methylcitrate dehydratase PrpD
MMRSKVEVSAPDIETGRGKDHERSASEGFTEKVASYCSHSRLEDIPEHVRERAKFVILDGIGCGLYGARLPWSEILIRTVAPFSEGGRSTVWGTNLRLPPDHAALLNGSFIQGFELDDAHSVGGLHECANVVPAALSATDLVEGVSGADLLTAIITGFEVGPRVGMCVGAARILERGWHGGAVVGIFGAAAAAGRVLGLSPVQMIHALGIAGTQASGLMAAQYGSMVKRMHHGKSTQGGFYAAALARNGYTGIEHIFEQPYGGYCSTLTDSLEGCDLTQLTDGLGTRYETERIKLKSYACNGSIHPSLEAIKTIRKRRPFAGTDVRTVEVRCTKATFGHVGWEYDASAASVTSAQMNLSFGIAVMVETGEAFVDQYTEATIRSPRFVDFARKVTAIHEPAFDSLGPSHRHHTELTIQFTDGTRETETVVARLPVSNEAVLAKYDRLACETLTAPQASELKEAILGLEELPDARIVSKLLASSKK